MSKAWLPLQTKAKNLFSGFLIKAKKDSRTGYKTTNLSHINIINKINAPHELRQVNLNITLKLAIFLIKL